jgi:hypothetical protein
MKIYRRYRQHPSPDSPVPQQRGRSTVHAVLTCKPKNALSIFAGRATTAVKYGIYCGKRRKIIMNKIGGLVHIDCRQLSKGITLARPGRTYHLPGTQSPVPGGSDRRQKGS